MDRHEGPSRAAELAIGVRWVDDAACGSFEVLGIAEIVIAGRLESNPVDSGPRSSLDNSDGISPTVKALGGSVFTRVVFSTSTVGRATVVFEPMARKLDPAEVSIATLKDVLSSTMTAPAFGVKVTPFRMYRPLLSSDIVTDGSATTLTSSEDVPGRDTRAADMASEGPNELCSSMASAAEFGSPVDETCGLLSRRDPEDVMLGSPCASEGRSCIGDGLPSAVLVAYGGSNAGGSFDLITAVSPNPFCGVDAVPPERF